jgi:hypothetical protein
MGLIDERKKKLNVEHLMSGSLRRETLGNPGRELAILDCPVGVFANLR